MQCFIDGRLLTSMDRLTLPGAEAHGLGLLQRCREIAADLLPDADIRVVEGDVGTSSQDPEHIRWHSLYDAVRAEIASCAAGPDRRVLLPCPGAGVVSRSLLERLLDHLSSRLPDRPSESGAERVLASADPLHHNAHPSWVMRAEGRFDTEERSYDADSSLHYLIETEKCHECLRPGQEPLPTPDRIKGSHRLPKLLLTSEAVVLATSPDALAAARAGGPMEHLSSADCPDVPPIYCQPIFTMTL